MGIANLAYQALDKKVMDLVESSVIGVNKLTGLGKYDITTALYFSAFESIATGLFLEGNKAMGLTIGFFGGFVSLLDYMSNVVSKDEIVQKQIESYDPITKRKIDEKNKKWELIYKTY
jgi:hypothetical protein